MLRDKVRELLRDYCVGSGVDVKCTEGKSPDAILVDFLEQCIDRFESAEKRGRFDQGRRPIDGRYRFDVSVRCTTLERLLKPGVFLGREAWIPPNAEIRYVQYNPKRDVIEVIFDTTYDLGLYELDDTQEPPDYDFRAPLDLVEASDKELIEVMKDPHTGPYLVRLAQRVLDMDMG